MGIVLFDGIGAWPQLSEKYEEWNGYGIRV
jgi:hypothetical protein